MTTTPTEPTPPAAPTRDQGGQPSGQAQSADNNEPGYPPGTPLAEMSVEHQLAYYKAHARKQEDRSKAWFAAVGGKTPEEVTAERAELDRLRDSQRTDAEKAVEEARRTAQAETAAQWAPKLAAAEFRAALSHLDAQRRDQIIDGLNLAAYITDTGDVDTDKVKSYAAAIAPADTGQGKPQRIDFGAGRRDSAPRSGVGAGTELFAASRKSTSNGS